MTKYHLNTDSKKAWTTEPLGCLNHQITLGGEGKEVDVVPPISNISLLVLYVLIKQLCNFQLILFLAKIIPGISPFNQDGVTWWGVGGFPDGSVVKNPPDNAGDTGDQGFIHESGRSPGRGNGNPLQYSCLGNSTYKGNLVGYSPWGHKELDMTEYKHNGVIQTYLFFHLTT